MDKKDLKCLSSEFLKEIEDILSTEAFLEIRKYHHHNHTDRLKHSIHVSYFAWKLAEKFRCDRTLAARTGLLHDFCPYDFAERTPTGEHQAFYHPKAAVENSRKYFSITKKEESVIATHMFPVGPIPRYKEAWIVIAADKICTIAEYCNVSLVPEPVL